MFFPFLFPTQMVLPADEQTEDGIPLQVDRWGCGYSGKGNVLFTYKFKLPDEPR
jgi:hypothetical protein